MARLRLKDELLDAQLLRAVGAAVYDGADVGECMQAASEVRESDLDSWYRAWHGLADRVRRLADEQLEARRRVSARGAYLRASTYYRTSGVMLLGAPVDPRLKQANFLQTETFRSAMELMEASVQTVAIPYEDTMLPGYFLSADDSSGPRPTVVLNGGYDGTCEELYFYNGSAALARGYNVLMFDGPGQGAALLQQGLTLRADWEAVISPVIDYAVARPEVDGSRIALIGLSLGAHLAPRAAAAEHRIAALIVDCGSFDLHAAMLQRLPGPLAKGFAAGRPWARRLVGTLMGSMARRPTMGWALRRGQLTHGVDSPLAYVDSLIDYTLADHAERITCPTWVCNAEDDDISASASDFAARLRCPHEFVRFTTAEGAGDHCEAAARTLYHTRSFGWLDRHLCP